MIFLKVKVIFKSYKTTLMYNASLICLKRIEWSIFSKDWEKEGNKEIETAEEDSKERRQEEQRILSLLGGEDLLRKTDSRSKQVIG